MTFRYVGTGEEQSVLLVGSFNGWQTSGDKKIELTKESDRIWSVTKTLPDGKHMYKFVVDGNWKPDPLNNNQVDDGYGGKNSVVVVGQPVQQQRIVTLVGNLQDELGHTGEWDPKATATIMKHEGDGLYTFTGTLPAGTYKYKIAINGSWDENYGAGGRDGTDIPLTLEKETKSDVLLS